MWLHQPEQHVVFRQNIREAKTGFSDGGCGVYFAGFGKGAGRLGTGAFLGVAPMR
jgi:hypothetical protein